MILSATPTTPTPLQLLLLVLVLGAAAQFLLFLGNWAGRDRESKSKSMASATLSMVGMANCSTTLKPSRKSFHELCGLKSSDLYGTAALRNKERFLLTLHTCATGPSAQKRSFVVEAKLKVAINGFGRIGRNFLRCWHGRKDSPLDVIVINDTGGVKQASHLLKYDSTLGIFEADVKVAGDDGISVDGKVIKVVSDRNPVNLPWGVSLPPVRRQVVQASRFITRHGQRKLLLIGNRVKPKALEALSC